MARPENPLLTILLGMVSLAGFASFLGVLVILVPERDLLTVVAISLLMAMWDFWLSVRPKPGR
jgi:hypothetical protein